MNRSNRIEDDNTRRRTKDSISKNICEAIFAANINIADLKGVGEGDKAIKPLKLSLSQHAATKSCMLLDDPASRYKKKERKSGGGWWVGLTDDA